MIFKNTLDKAGDDEADPYSYIIKIPRVCGYYCKISLYVFSAPSSVLNCSYYIFNEIIKFWKCKEPNHIYILKKNNSTPHTFYSLKYPIYCTSFFVNAKLLLFWTISKTMVAFCILHKILLWCGFFVKWKNTIVKFNISTTKDIILFFFCK